MLCHEDILGRFTILTQTIMHLSYPDPTPTKFCITIVFDFSWDDCNIQEKLDTMVMQSFKGVNKVHYGLCENGGFCAKVNFSVNFITLLKNIYFSYILLSSYLYYFFNRINVRIRER